MKGKIWGSTEERRSQLCCSFVQALFLQYFSEIVNVETVTQTGVFHRRLNYCDVSVAGVASVRLRAVQHAKGFDFSTVEANDLVAVLCYSSVSVMHKVMSLRVLKVFRLRLVTVPPLPPDPRFSSSGLR